MDTALNSIRAAHIPCGIRKVTRFLCTLRTPPIHWPNGARAGLKTKVRGDCYHRRRLFYNVDFKYYSKNQGDESSDEHHRGHSRVQPTRPDSRYWLWPR